MTFMLLSLYKPLIGTVRVICYVWSHSSSLKDYSSIKEIKTNCMLYMQPVYFNESFFQ